MKIFGLSLSVLCSFLVVHAETPFSQNWSEKDEANKPVPFIDDIHLLTIATTNIPVENAVREGFRGIQAEFSAGNFENDELSVKVRVTNLSGKSVLLALASMSSYAGLSVQRNGILSGKLIKSLEVENGDKIFRLLQPGESFQLEKKFSLNPSDLATDSKFDLAFVHRGFFPDQSVWFEIPLAVKGRLTVEGRVLTDK